jgi:hypothetical protein
VALLAKKRLGSASNSAASDKGHAGALYSKNNDWAAEVGMALFTTALGIYGGVLWSDELQGFVIHEVVPTPTTPPASHTATGAPPTSLVDCRFLGLGRAAATAPSLPVDLQERASEQHRTEHRAQSSQLPAKPAVHICLVPGVPKFSATCGTRGMFGLNESTVITTREACVLCRYVAYK